MTPFRSISATIRPVSEEGAGTPVPPEKPGEKPSTNLGAWLAFAGVVVGGIVTIVVALINRGGNPEKPTVQTIPTTVLKEVATGTPIAATTPIPTPTPSSVLHLSTQDYQALATPTATPIARAEVTIQNFTLKIISTELDYKKERPTLRFNIRIMNNGDSNYVFDEHSFQLVEDGIPRAPIGDFYFGVSAHSAEDVAFVFEFNPRETKSAALVFWVRDQSETISVNLPIN